MVPGNLACFHLGQVGKAWTWLDLNLEEVPYDSSWSIGDGPGEELPLGKFFKSCGSCHEAVFHYLLCFSWAKDFPPHVLLPSCLSTAAGFCKSIKLYVCSFELAPPWLSNPPLMPSVVWSLQRGAILWEQGGGELTPGSSCFGCVSNKNSESIWACFLLIIQIQEHEQAKLAAAFVIAPNDCLPSWHLLCPRH